MRFLMLIVAVVMLAGAPADPITPAQLSPTVVCRPRIRRGKR
jgi:hypothetical protein